MMSPTSLANVNAQSEGAHLDYVIFKGLVCFFPFLADVSLVILLDVF